jgi:hypothetical protein
MIDSFHCSGSSSLFQIGIISLWISQQTVLPPALILLGYDQYLVICDFLEAYTDTAKNIKATLASTKAQ